MKSSTTSKQDLFLLGIVCFCGWLLMEGCNKLTERRSKTDFETNSRKAHEGDHEGQLQLGLCYSLGSGVPVNKVEAVRWFRAAAMQGNADAQHQIGWAYFSGEGLGKDHYQAFLWFNLASISDPVSYRGGVNEELKSNIGKQMTPVQIAEAQRDTFEIKAVIEAQRAGHRKN